MPQRCADGGVSRSSLPQPAACVTSRTAASISLVTCSSAASCASVPRAVMPCSCTTSFANSAEECAVHSSAPSPSRPARRLGLLLSLLSQDSTGFSATKMPSGAPSSGVASSSISAKLGAAPCAAALIDPAMSGAAASSTGAMARSVATSASKRIASVAPFRRTRASQPAPAPSGAATPSSSARVTMLAPRSSASCSSCAHRSAIAPVAPPTSLRFLLTSSTKRPCRESSVPKVPSHSASAPASRSRSHVLEKRALFADTNWQPWSQRGSEYSGGANRVLARPPTLRPRSNTTARTPPSPSARAHARPATPPPNTPNGNRS